MTVDPIKNAKFHEMKGKRLPNALKQLELLGSLGKSKVVEFTNQEAEGLVDVVDNALSDMANMLGVSRIKAEGPASDDFAEFEYADDLPEEPPVAEAPPAPEAPRSMKHGALELNDKESMYLLRVGSQLGAAINALEDQKPDEAMDLLLNLMRS